MRIDKKFIINNLGNRSSDLANKIGIIVSKDTPRQIKYGYYNSIFGEVIIGLSGDDICWLGFTVDRNGKDGVDVMFARYNNSLFIKDNGAVKLMADRIFSDADKISIVLSGSDFQMDVWMAMLRIDKGFVTSYGEIAKLLGKEKASRAVGGAVGANPVSLLIPCHRVVQANGNINNYLWGNEKKLEILRSEIKDISH